MTCQVWRNSAITRPNTIFIVFVLVTGQLLSLFFENGIYCLAHFKWLIYNETHTLYALNVVSPQTHVIILQHLMFVDPCIIVQFIMKNPTRCNNVSKFYYSIFIWSSKCFRRHTAHHREPKTALAASGFAYGEGCWMCSWWTLSGTVCDAVPDNTVHLTNTDGERLHAGNN